MSADDAIAVYNAIVVAISSMGDAILDNWQSFALLQLVVIIIVILLTRKYYKHKEENIKYREDSVELKCKELDSLKEDMEQLKKENAEMKSELNSKEYLAYLEAKGLSKNSLDESNMFR